CTEAQCDKIICTKCGLEDHKIHNIVSLQVLSDDLKSEMVEMRSRIVECCSSYEYKSRLLKIQLAKNKVMEHVLITRQALCDKVKHLKALIDTQCKKECKILDVYEEESLSALQRTKEEMEIWKQTLENISHRMEKLL